MRDNRVCYCVALSIDFLGEFICMPARMAVHRVMSFDALAPELLPRMPKRVEACCRARWAVSELVRRSGAPMMATPSALTRMAA